MKIVKALFNILGIILAWVLSVALIIMLVVSPIVFSALSLLNPQVITEAVTSIFKQSAPVSCAPVFDGTTMHASTSGSNSGGLLAGMDLNGIIEDVFEEMFEGVEGVEIDTEIVQKVINSDAAKDLIESYTEDIANAFAGSGEEMKFNADKLVEIVENNIDEIVDIIQEVTRDETLDKEKIKTEITTAVADNAESIMQALPKPEALKEQLVGNSPELESIFKILAMKDTIELGVIAVIVVLALLIFVCRIPGFRGFRWLATILYITGGINALIGGGMMFSGAALMNALPAEVAIISGIVETFITAFATNILVRAGIMLVVAIAFTVAYVIIKKAIKKRKAARAAAELETMQTASAETAELEAVTVATEGIVTEEIVAEEIVEEEPATVTEQ